MSDYYTESQMQRIEQAAYDGAMLEAGKEWEHERGVSEEREAALEKRNADLVAFIERLIETGRPLCDYAILVSFDHPMGDGQMALNDKSAWDALVTEWQKERETC